MPRPQPDSSEVTVGQDMFHHRGQLTLPVQLAAIKPAGRRITNGKRDCGWGSAFHKSVYPTHQSAGARLRPPRHEIGDLATQSKSGLALRSTGIEHRATGTDLGDHTTHQIHLTSNGKSRQDRFWRRIQSR